MTNPIKLFGAIAALILLVWVGIWYGTFTFIDNFAAHGQFGDLFGSANALFSGLALAGVIVTILLQRTELQMQREELKLQREEMAKSRQHLAEQVAMQKANLNATIAHLHTLAFQADIQAIEMESLQRNPGGRQQEVGQIRKIADNMRRNIGALEQLANEN